MTDLDDLPWSADASSPSFTGANGRRCSHHYVRQADGGRVCDHCGRQRDETVARRNRNNSKRGGKAELDVARLVGGRKVGPLGLPWDVEIAGYARLQSKKLDTWPSVNQILAWLAAIPAEPELRGVVILEAAGRGKRGRAVIVFDAAEWARWHGGTNR